MRVHLTEDGRGDYRHWVENDRDRLGRVNDLIEDVRRHLFKGLGKPEPLKGDLSGWWSRRTNGDHRLIYRVAGQAGVDQPVEIAACRYHYGDG